MYMRIWLMKKITVSTMRSSCRILLFKCSLSFVNSAIFSVCLSCLACSSSYSFRSCSLATLSWFNCYITLSVSSVIFAALFSNNCCVSCVFSRSWLCKLFISSVISVTLALFSSSSECILFWSCRADSRSWEFLSSRSCFSCIKCSILFSYSDESSSLASWTAAIFFCSRLTLFCRVIVF